MAVQFLISEGCNFQGELNGRMGNAEQRISRGAATEVGFVIANGL